jgi:hypothetical protein
MAGISQQGGSLRVVSNAEIDRREKDAASSKQVTQEVEMDELARHIRSQYEMMKMHRDSGNSGWSNRLLSAMRVFNGQYEPSKLADIKQFGGSEIYARLVAMKCRGAHALLRDVYISPEKPWALNPPADPDVPQEIMDSITSLVASEMRSMMQEGVPPDINAIRDRTAQLLAAARIAATKQAKDRAKLAEAKMQEILEEGGFYRALAEFLVDLPLFPFACIKGPTVRIVPTVVWNGNTPTTENRPRLFWQRVSPFDIWWTPGVSDIGQAAIIERQRLTRADLNDLLDLPGYNHDAVRQVLRDYGQGGLNDDWDSTDSARAVQENRENPTVNRSGLISCLEFHGNVQGSMLLDWGMDEAEVPDPDRDYFVQAWLIGRWVIKVQLSPSPRKRHPYAITSFEKVPGTPVGNGLPDILGDIQDVANATLRSLVNNMSISSGPQVVVNYERLHPNEDGQQMYPWKRWFVSSDPMGNTQQMPISFFQPNSNAQELLGVYKEFCNIADEISAIPKYLSGEGASGGAGRTAAGLAMLMGNASKILQTVAANIDRDVMDPMLQALLDMVMLTDQSGMLTGQETLKVMGVNVAVQKETQRARQLEFLQVTANPIDMQIMGVPGRAAVLRSVSQTIGLDGEQVVPASDQIEQQMKAAQAGVMGGPPGAPGDPALANAGAEAQGDQAGGENTGTTKDMGPRVRLDGGAG